MALRDSRQKRAIPARPKDDLRERHHHQARNLGTGASLNLHSRFTVLVFSCTPPPPKTLHPRSSGKSSPVLLLKQITEQLELISSLRSGAATLFQVYASCGDSEIRHNRYPRARFWVSRAPSQPKWASMRTEASYAEGPTWQGDCKSPSPKGKGPFQATPDEGSGVFDFPAPSVCISL